MLIVFIRTFQNSGRPGVASHPRIQHWDINWLHNWKLFQLRNGSHCFARLPNHIFIQLLFLPRIAVLFS